MSQGKGDRNRTADRAAFERNYDAIDWDQPGGVRCWSEPGDTCRPSLRFGAALVPEPPDSER